jgi:hypothetical protein
MILSHLELFWGKESGQESLFPRVVNKKIACIAKLSSFLIWPKPDKGVCNNEF